jgi:HJR/Mrr/RecB family endonuclease
MTDDELAQAEQSVMPAKIEADAHHAAAKAALSGFNHWWNGNRVYQQAYEDYKQLVLKRAAAVWAELDRRKTLAHQATQQKAKADRQSRLQTLGGWMGLSPIEFEHACGRLLKTAGYDRVTVTKASGDGGVDAIAERGGKRYAVQCKKYQGTIDPNDIRALAGVVAIRGYAGGIFMTTGAISQATRAEAKHAGLRIYTSQELVDLAIRGDPHAGVDSINVDIGEDPMVGMLPDDPSFSSVGDSDHGCGT